MPVARAPVWRTLSRSVRYVTDYGLTENPLSEGSIYDGGATVGLDWKNMQSASGRAYGSSVNAGGAGSGGPFDDNWSVLKPSFKRFSRNQWIRSVVYVEPGYAPVDPAFHEFEHLLRATVGPNFITCLECSWSKTEGKLNVIRWQGALNDFSATLSSFTIPGGILDGDEIENSMIGDTAYHRIIRGGTELVLGSTTDTLTLAGQPGIGVWMRTGGTLPNYGPTQTIYGDC